MVISIIIAIITCMGIMACILFKPSIKIKNIELQTFWMVALLGAIMMLLFNVLPIPTLISKLSENSVVNPFKILILFISLSILSITLDVLGVFKYLAIKVANRFNNSQYGLFFSLYILIAILTIFTSNDIIILTFTPFICYFSKHAKINPIPFLVMQFVVANTYSMALYIGNPTNIYLSQASGIGFMDYLKVMWLPTLFAGIASLITLLLIFKKSLNQNIEMIDVENVKLENKPLIFISVGILSACTCLLAISSYINLEMWIVCLLSALVLTTFIIVLSKNKKETLLSVYKRAPYSLIVFVLSMYTIVISLNHTGVTYKMGELIANVVKSDTSLILAYGGLSALFDSFVNNIPMSILFSSVISTDFSFPALYATVIGSNIGAYLTPMASLAGIMWLSMLKKHEIEYSFAKFIKYGIILTPVILSCSLIGLIIIL